MHAIADVRLTNQGNPFTRTQAADLGLVGWRLDAAVRTGMLRRVLHSVYVDAEVPDTRRLRCLSLHLVLPPHAVLFGTTAAWLLGIDAFQPEERFVLTPRCVVPHGTTRRTGLGVSTVEGYIPDADVATTDGLRLTVPERTAADLLRRLRRPFALSAADAMAHAGLVGAAGLQQRLDRLRGYPGIVQARQLVRWIEPLTESAGESWQRLRLLDAGFPRPRPQVWVRDRAGCRVYRLDLAYPDLLVACEYDGTEDHTSAADRRFDEKRREDLARRWGWRIVVADKTSILGPDPGFEAEVGTLIGRVPTLPRGW